MGLVGMNVAGISCLKITEPMQVTAAIEEDIPALCRLLELLFSQEAEFRPDAGAHDLIPCHSITDAISPPYLTPSSNLRSQIPQAPKVGIRRRGRALHFSGSGNSFGSEALSRIGECLIHKNPAADHCSVREIADPAAQHFPERDLPISRRLLVRVLF